MSESAALKKPGSGVLRYTDAEIRKGGELLKYPNTKLQKAMRFPLGIHFNSFSYFRSIGVCWVVFAYAWYKISQPLLSEENKEKFRLINEKRKHSRFDPIHE